MPSPTDSYSSALPGARRCLPNPDGAAVFYEAAALSTDELEAVLLKIITRTMRLLTRLGALIEEPERTYLAETDSDGALKSLQAASCTYRIAPASRAVRAFSALPTVAMTRDPSHFANRKEFFGSVPVHERAQYQHLESSQLPPPRKGSRPPTSECFWISARMQRSSFILLKSPSDYDL